MTTWPTVFFVAQSAPSDPVGLLAQFGAWGASLLVLWLWQRDTAKDRDRLLSIVEQQQPILIETREVLRTASETVRAAAAAMASMSDVVQRVPTESDITRMRVALEDAERAAQAAARRREGT